MRRAPFQQCISVLRKQVCQHVRGIKHRTRPTQYRHQSSSQPEYQQLLAYRWIAAVVAAGKYHTWLPPLLDAKAYHGCAASAVRTKYMPMSAAASKSHTGRTKSTVPCHNNVPQATDPIQAAINDGAAYAAPLPWPQREPTRLRWHRKTAQPAP